MTNAKMIGLRSIFVALAVLFSAAAFAQNVTVKGVVKDAEGAPLPGATVFVPGTSNGTVADADGNFSIQVPANTDLEVSFLGYASQTIKVGTTAGFQEIVLSDSETLNEVVVTALGVAKQAKSLGYATQRVSTTEIERVNAINPVNALQGKVAGMTINTGGASGITSSSSIVIRGAKSIDKNNSPIFVIDGMIIQEPVTGNLSGTDWGSQLKNLNPADYESINVLKGAAATALYGSRGANGAIVIVSKGGQYGKKGLGVEFNQICEWTDIYKAPVDFQDEYGMGVTYGGYQSDFLPDGSLQQTSNSFGPKFDGSLRNQYMPGGEKTPYVAHPDNWKSIYRNGFNTTTNVAISGGGEKSSFRLSYGFTDNNGVFIRNEFKRHNIAFRGITDLNKVFSVEVGVKYAFSKAMNGASQGGWDWGNNAGMMTTYYMPRSMDLATFKANYRNEDKSIYTDSWSSISSYLHTRDMNTQERDERSMLADLTLRAHIAPWLEGSVKANYNYYNWEQMYQNYGSGANYGPSGSGSYGRSGQTEGNYNFLAMLQSNDNKIKIGNEEILLSAIVAGELYGNTSKNNWSKGTNGGLVEPAVFAFSNSKNKIEPSFTYTPANQRTLGLSGILNLSWRDQVFLEVTARNDWLSTLTYPTYITGGQNNYSVFYPSVNASWVFSDTFKLPSWFSFGKVRASVARVGMGTSAYSTTKGFGVFSQSNIYLPDKSGSVLAAKPNLGTAFNPDLKPEIQQSIEFGLDLRFFQERLNFDIAYYKTNTYNQIMSLSSVSESGASTQLINAGDIQNQGVEIQFEGVPVRTSDWRWSIGGNFALNRGKVNKLCEGVTEWTLMGEYDAAPGIYAFEGGDFGVLMSYKNSSYCSPIAKFQGAEGDPRNGKMLIQYDQAYGSPYPVAMYSPVTEYQKGNKDRFVLGKVEPDFTLSLNTSLSYKNFDLYIQGDGRFGGKFFSNVWKYAAPNGCFKSSLEGRDKEHGGIARINYKGETSYDGLMLDAVFEEGTQAPTQNPDGTIGGLIDVGGMTYAEAVTQHNVVPVMTGSWYAWNYGWGMPLLDGPLQDNTWFMLREVTLGYRLPERILKNTFIDYLRVGVTARNICYIINHLTDGLNPESISNNNPLQPMDIGAVPFYRTFAANITLRF